MVCKVRYAYITPYLAGSLSLVEMLVILGIFPVAAPSETLCAEEAVAQVVSVDHIGVLARAVGISLAALWVDDAAAVFVVDIRIVERVDIHRHTVGVAREHRLAWHLAVVESRAVIGSHTAAVIAVVVVDQLHPLNGIAGLEELAQDVEHIVGNALVEHHLANEGAAVRGAVEAAQIAQFAPLHRAPRLVTLALHTCKYIVGYRRHLEERCVAVRLEIRFGNLIARGILRTQG